MAAGDPRRTSRGWADLGQHRLRGGVLLLHHAGVVPGRHVVERIHHKIWAGWAANATGFTVCARQLLPAASAALRSPRPPALRGRGPTAPPEFVS